MSGGDRSKVLPSSTLLTQTERNRRSEEMIVAKYDPSPEEVENLGWKKIVGKARGKRREETVAAPEVVTPSGDEDWAEGAITLLRGDFRERLDDLPDGSVDLIVTDPPYPAEDLHLWGDLSELAGRVLGPRGILFAMTGQMYLPQVMDYLAGNLNFGWIYNMNLTHYNNRIMGRHIIQTWKPIVAYSKELWPSGEWGTDTLMSGKRVKDLYKWQQPVEPMQDLIERFAPSDGLVLDPFLGVGSFGVAAKQARRRFIGVELHEGRFNQSVERMG